MRLAPPMLLLMASAMPLAAETAIRIAGLQSATEEEVFAVIGGRLDHIKAQRATPSRAADAAFLVERLARRRGLNQATVSWKIVGPEVIQLTIDEGPRDLLGTVTIENVANEDVRKTLVGLFELTPMKRRVGVGNRPPVSREDIDPGLEYIRQELYSKSFWDAEAEVSRWERNPETGEIDVTIEVRAGPSHKIGRPIFHGRDTAGIAREVEGFIGRPAHTPNVNALRLAVVEHFRGRGFVKAKVSMDIRNEGTTMVPVFTVTEGKRFRVGEIRFEGLEKTRAERIAVRLEGLEGEYADSGRFEKRIRQIVATGAFSSLETDITERGDYVDATLRFEEGRARGVSLTAGAGSYEGFILGASYYDRNFRGGLRNFDAGIELSGRGLLGQISLTDPWILGSDVAGTVKLYSLTRSEEGYDNWRVGLEGSLLWQPSKTRTLTAALGYAFASTSDDGLPPTALGTRDYGNPYLRFMHRWDHRDSPVVPTKGWHFEIPIEIGAVLGDISSNYIKPELSGSWHHPLGSSGQLALGARGGLIITDTSPGDFPIALRFFNGGARSVRSFPERELGPRSRTGYPTGGQAYWVTNLEYIRAIAGPLKGVVFVDAGGLTENWEDLGFDSPEVALGLGIRFDLPVGPVRFEYGHNLTQDLGEPSGSWHFAIGTAF